MHTKTCFIGVSFLLDINQFHQYDSGLLVTWLSQQPHPCPGTYETILMNMGKYKTFNEWDKIYAHFDKSPQLLCTLYVAYWYCRCGNLNITALAKYVGG